VGVAVVNNQPISQAEYRQYVLYASRFYAASGQGHCPGTQSACALLQHQVLRRLMEQAVVRQYAAGHNISVSPSERRQVAAQLASIALPGTPTGTLLDRGEVSRSFLRSLLTDEVLVQAVERAVVPARIDRGRSYRLRIVTIPISAGGRQAAYRAALELATNGGSAPSGSEDRTEWVAAFRLSAAVQRLIEHAEIGQYLGPFDRPGGYRVFQLLGQKRGRYGRPARQRLETAYFRHWLGAQLSAAHPVCYSGGREVACPSA
jgi:hypothetical protein